MEIKAEGGGRGGRKKLFPGQEGKGQVTEHLDMLMENIKDKGGAGCWFLRSRQSQFMPGKLVQALALCTGSVSVNMWKHPY